MGIVTSQYFIKCHGRLSVIFLKKHPIKKPSKSPYSEEVLSMTEEQKKQIIRLRKKGCGYTAVANKVGISKDTVKSFCRRNGLAGEMAAVQGDSVPGCRECGKPFTAYGNSRRKYCSHECYIRNRFKGGDAGE